MQKPDDHLTATPVEPPLAGRTAPLAAPGDAAYAADLYAVDLDGTLLDSRGRVPERNRAALHRLHEDGVRVVLCTGRALPETTPVLAEIGLDLDATVTCSGAVISDARTLRTLRRWSMSKDLAHAVAAWLADRGHTPIWCVDRTEADGLDGYVFRGVPRHPRVAGWLATTPCRMEEVDAIPPAAAAPVRIAAIDDPAALQALEAHFRVAFAGRADHCVLHAPSYNICVIETFAHGVSKWAGVAHLCELWGLDAGRTVAVGDDANDLEMLRRAGVGVAMANARELVLQSTPVRTKSNNEGGVADVAERILAARAAAARKGRA